MEKSIKISYKVSYKVLLVLYSILIFVLSLRHLPELHQLYVLHDEFGYWANAAFFAGNDWSGISTISPYYSYGYSLVIAPLFWIFENPLTVYKAALCLNAVFYVCSFLVSFVCARKLFPAIRPGVAATICLVAALYCNNLMQCGMAWSEPFIYLMYWVSCLTLICYLEKYQMRWLVLFGVELVFLYTIHQRALGVLLAGILVAAVLFLFGRQSDSSGKRTVLQAFAFVGTVAVCLCLSILVKKYLQDNLWVWDATQADIASRNDYSGQLTKVREILTSFDTFKDFLISVAGKVFYLLAASALLIFWGAKDALVRVVGSFREKKVTSSAIWLYFLLSTAAALGINAIFCTFMERTDGYVYGRYMEYTIGPLLLIGLVCLYEKKERMWSLVSGGALLVISGLAVKKYLEMPGAYVFINSAGTSLFYETSTQLFHTLDCILAAGILAVVLFVLSHFPKKKWLSLLAVVPLVGFWFFSAENVLENGPLFWQKYIKNVSVIAETVEELDGDTEIPIYYIENPDAGDTAWRIEQVQFLMPDRKICKIEYDDLTDLGGDYYLIHNDTKNIDLKKYVVATQAYGMDVLVPVKSELGQRTKEYLYTHDYKFSDTMMHNATSGDAHTFLSDHQEGFLVYMQDLSLGAGTYQADMRLKVSDVQDDLLGYIDVSDEFGEVIIARKEIRASDFEDGENVRILYEFECGDAHHVEIRFYTYGSAKIELEDLKYRAVRR